MNVFSHNPAYITASCSRHTSTIAEVRALTYDNHEENIKLQESELRMHLRRMNISSLRKSFGIRINGSPELAM